MWWLCLVGVAVVGVARGVGGATPKEPNKINDDHKYYTLSVFQNNAAGSFDKHFIDMENAQLKKGLSDTKLGAENIRPAFPFPFYGHYVNEFYVTTHGFLSLSPRLHDYIYKTQYIAPLRIKLDPSRSNSSTISVLNLPDRLTVEWSNVSVSQDAEHPSGGSFTFQVTLTPNGDIVFVYIEVQPVLTTAALYDHEPVAGISDAFLLHGSELHLYNKINIANPDINTRTVAIFKSLPSCVSQSSCSSCSHLRSSSNFSCLWCEKAGHCSDGADRLRQHWNDNMCHIANTTTCTGDLSGNHVGGRHSALGSPVDKTSSSATVISAVISSLLVVVLVVILVVFVVLYAKYNKDSPLGRHINRLRNSYEEFGAASGKKIASLELGKKMSELKGEGKSKKAASKPVSEFTNPHPMNTNNNIITASM